MRRPPYCSAGVIAATVRGHASVDRAARNYSAYRACCDTEQSVPDEAVADDCTGHAARHLSGRRRRPAADLMGVGSTAVIMVAVPGPGLGRDGNGSHGGGSKRRCAYEFRKASHKRFLLFLGPPTLQRFQRSQACSADR